MGLVEANALPGKMALDRSLGRCEITPRAPKGAPATVEERTFRSRYRRTDVGMAVITPASGGRGLPVAVALHGWGDSAHGLVHNLALDRYLGDAMARGVPPFAIVTVDGGPTYWHPRADGDDPLRMISEELLPGLARRGLRADRIGVMGVSMGGYGALLLAETLGIGRVAATAASSPAVFGSFAAARRTNSHSFDDRSDFARHDAVGGLARLDPRTTWVDCGRSDPFSGVTRRIRERLGHPSGGMFEGCHDASYWRSRLPGQLEFFGHHLTA
ncbi:MAG: esterase [Actinoallomurus sp.]|jgi:S-formylglutathione hydrolase FrmB|nr:esterase [Actinoallomurus sp.]